MSSPQLKTSLFHTEKRSTPRRSVLILKRLLDLMIATLAFVLLLPVMVVIGIAVKIDSPGPVIFKQKRAGLHGKPFTIYKFRTMVRDAEKHFKLNVSRENLKDFVFQDKKDPRVTRVGAFLRRTSLDELPQLWNVIIGDMSLVGPRPEILEIVNLYDEEQKKRLEVKPGITGLAQVMGRGEIPLGETIKWDLEYIKNMSLKFDLWILWKTIGVVFSGKGAR